MQGRFGGKMKSGEKINSGLDLLDPGLHDCGRTVSHRKVHNCIQRSGRQSSLRRRHEEKKATLNSQNMFGSSFSRNFCVIKYYRDDIKVDEMFCK